MKADNNGSPSNQSCDAFADPAIIVPRTVQALDIKDYFRMADEDHARFNQTLLDSAEKVLRDAGRSDLARKLDDLCTEIKPGDLARARVADIENLEKNPRADRLEVEDAMFVTLKKNGIELPDSFFTVASGFRPKLPRKQ
jgi:hypothetical protein